MAARIRKIKMNEDWIARIQTCKIIDRLSGHVQGTVKLTATQVAAAKILLSKVVPDVAKTEITGANGGPLQSVTSEVSPEKLEEIARRLLTRV